MLKHAIPVLHVTSSAKAEDFYSRALGFRREFAYRPDESTQDPCYFGVSRDGVWLHLSSFSGDGVAGAAVCILVQDVDALFAEFKVRKVPIHLEPVDQTWGNREMYVKDPDGNSIRFTQLLQQ